MSFFDRSFGSTIGPLKNGSKNGVSTDKLIEKVLLHKIIK